jgi:stress-induced morphogen
MILKNLVNQSQRCKFLEESLSFNKAIKDKKTREKKKRQVPYEHGTLNNTEFFFCLTASEAFMGKVLINQKRTNYSIVSLKIVL